MSKGGFVMQINKRITKTNYKKGNGKKNKYIIIHYVGATGGAEANANYFYSEYRGASAHYFVGHKGEVWQVVNDEDVAWHVGATRYKHPDCRNSNSIGIEMCCRKNIGNNTWYFEEETIKATIELTKELMKKHNIPAENVLRHYDITGKTCPEPYVRDSQAWNSFKASLTATTATTGYLVRVTADELNVRKGAGTGYGITTTIKKNGVYTIVDEFKGWGKLKSGAGWIKLSYTERV
jgi:N-acetyl-anhydromuramyl-L-alanine amidase AmpD